MSDRLLPVTAKTAVVLPPSGFAGVAPDARWSEEMESVVDDRTGFTPTSLALLMELQEAATATSSLSAFRKFSSLALLILNINGVPTLVSSSFLSAANFDGLTGSSGRNMAPSTAQFNTNPPYRVINQSIN